MPGYTGGWYLVAFEQSLGEELSPAAVGARRLLLVADRGSMIRAFDADCPHRGAHLAFGGCLQNGHVVCPFHGYSIRLGARAGEKFSVAEYPTLVAGGMVFVRLSEGHDNGWAEQASILDRDYWCVNGFEMTVRAPMELVIENAFDRLHFRSVHGIRNEEFDVRRGVGDALEVHGIFHIPSRRTGPNETTLTRPTVYRGIAISPGLAMTELEGEVPYRVITGATDAPEGGCVVRITVAFARADCTTEPAPEFVQPLLQYFRRGLEQDRVMWENRSCNHDPCWMPEDASVRQFQRFCAAFRD